MKISARIHESNVLSHTEGLFLPKNLVNLIAERIGVSALGLWIVMCTSPSDSSKQHICQKFNVPEQSFDKVISKLKRLNLVWSEYEFGEQELNVSNLPKPLFDSIEATVFEFQQAISSDSAFSYRQDDYISPVLVSEKLAENIENDTQESQSWYDLILDQVLIDIAIASAKLPPDSISGYWESFISSNELRGEVIPGKDLLRKKWRAYIAKVSVNLTVSDRRYNNAIQEQQEQKTARQQANIEAWQGLLEQHIPQDLSFLAAINNLAKVEQDVWQGFVQQNIRFKNEVMNKTNLKVAFEEYCKTTGQKFKQQLSKPNNQFDQQINDKAWAANLDDVL